MKYLYLVRASLLELLEYRANIPARVTALALNLSLNLLLWLAITKTKGDIFGYSQNQIILYYLFLSCVLPLTTGGTDFAQKIGEDIKEGNLIGILAKPINPIWFYTARAVSERIKDFLVLSPVSLTLILIINKSVYLNILLLGALLISLIIAFALDHLLMAVIGIVAFWTTEIGWASNFIRRLIDLFSGARFPINFYPSVILGVIKGTPLFYLVFFPSTIFLQKESPEIVGMILTSLLWVAVLFLLVVTLWRKGITRYEGTSQ